MYGYITRGILCALGFVLIPGAETQAIPESRTIIYTIYEDPDNKQSNIAYTVELDIEAADSDGDGIGWEILEARITDKNTGSNGDAVWTDAYPDVDSIDGLWWIDHDDGSALDVSEFVIPPLIEGVATPEAPQNDYLEYQLEGGLYTPPPQPGEPHFDVTTSLSFIFKRLSEPEPDAEADDLPADTDIDDSDS